MGKAGKIFFSSYASTLSETSDPYFYYPLPDTAPRVYNISNTDTGASRDCGVLPQEFPDDPLLLHDGLTTQYHKYFSRVLSVATRS